MACVACPRIAHSHRRADVRIDMRQACATRRWKALTELLPIQSRYRANIEPIAKELLHQRSSVATVDAYIVMAHIAMAYIVMAHIAMAYTVVAHAVMAHIDMASYSYGPCSYGP